MIMKYKYIKGYEYLFCEDFKKAGYNFECCGSCHDEVNEEQGYYCERWPENNYNNVESKLFALVCCRFNFNYSLTRNMAARVIKAKRKHERENKP